MPRPDEPPRPESPDPAAPSKTRRKQAMHALQDVGEALVALDHKRLMELELPERLVDAVVQARGIRAHEGRRRQIQYIGKLMRDIDAAPLLATLDRWAAGAPADHARFAAVERWRDELLVDATALDRFAIAHPNIDRPKLAALIHGAQLERARGGPPHRYRELFRVLRLAVAEDQTPPAVS
jgi:ribosome-associated protein